MLTQKEILNEVFTLSIPEQYEIAKKIENNIKKSSGNSKNELSIEERMAIVESLSGAAVVEGKTPPTDEEINEDYINYLTEKYK